jgi:hypothetical protein
MEERPYTLFELAGWITGITLGIGGYIISALGWNIRGKQQRSLAIKKDIHDSIDKTIKALTEYEDAVYSFWAEEDSKIRLDQIINFHRRCITNLNQLKHLKDFDIPNVELAELRKNATLDAESAERPLKQNSLRLKKFSKNMNKIMDSKALLKSWSD